ncbi:MAG TPA: hypothetical protein VD913_02545 [bacterium]|nr:hypothetical protein [bacterium]
MKKWAVILAVTCFFLQGCAALSSDYHSLKYSDSGYSELDLKYGVYYIEYKGDETMDIEKTDSYALLRAAELARANGYSYFVVKNHRTDVKTEERQDNYSLAESDYVPDECDIAYQNCGRSYTVQIPVSMITIESFKKKPKNEQKTAFNAHEAIQKIRQKYKLPAPDINTEAD